MMKKWIGPACIATGLAAAGCGGTQTGDMSGYNTRPLDNSTAVSPATSFGAATLGSKLIPLQGKPAFVAGIDVASFSGTSDLDFGKSPINTDASPAYDKKAIGASLQDMAGVGSNVIRVTVFSKMGGLKLDSNGLVAGLDDSFLKNFQDMLDQAEKKKLVVYVNFANFWPIIDNVKNPMIDTNARNAYLKKAVTPLIGKLRGRASVFGVSVADQIESAVQGKDGNGTDKGLTWDQARDYIKACVDVVKSADAKMMVSAGSGLHGWENVQAGKLSKLNLDFYDIHVYDDKGQLPPSRDLKVDRPILVGSCGQASTKVDPDVQAKADMAFLENAQKQGYAGALIEDYSKSKDNAQSLLDAEGKHKPVLAQFQSFVSSQASTAPVGTLGK